ncbi:MAG: fused MFS/spermidine synthase [Planctomycetota bacterium]|nr:fused MFS/spermidine synthase [Planctomycetota bacterium]
MAKIRHARGQQPSAGFAGWCAATIFLGAFLLFQIQPVIGKMILPWFGGSPAVWTTCMLFFQILLLAGYAYADLLARWCWPARQAALHAVLLAAALMTLPITPGVVWRPPDGSYPMWRILLLLAACVGLPYFLLSATSPLVQAWFARVYPDRSPYRLYALSNIGSLGALLSYPFVVEPALTSYQQGVIWSVAFVVFVGGCGWLARYLWRMPTAQRAGRDGSAGPPGSDASGPRRPAGSTASPFGEKATAPGWQDRGVWLLLPALASTMLLAVTNHLCQDVAVVPFLWIAPLSLYLLSFILCFDREAWYVRRWFALGAALGILAASYLAQWNFVEAFLSERNWHWPWANPKGNARLEIFVYLTLFFLLCMVCHGEAVRRKPVASRLTAFYLTVAAGGALGGVLVAVVCPWLWSSFLELNVGLVLGFGLSLGVFLIDAYPRWLTRTSPLLKTVGAVLGVVVLAVVVSAQWQAWDREGGLVRVRNFYGVLTVRERFPNDPQRRGLALYHGATQHGYQFLAEEKRRIPTNYFVERSGVGRALRCAQRNGPLRVGVIGLGAGTLATYGRPGDTFRFYEINPLVIQLAQEQFTFLQQSLAKIEVVAGDARLGLEREESQERQELFDVLVLDAFSGDSIPVHLLTREAVALYLRRLKQPDGVIAMHISNRYLDLVPVVAKLAALYELEAAVITNQELDELIVLPSQWMLLTRNRPFLRQDGIREVARIPRLVEGFPVWTDQYNNLFQVLRRPVSRAE